MNKCYIRITTLRILMNLKLNCYKEKGLGLSLPLRFLLHIFLLLFISQIRCDTQSQSIQLNKAACIALIICASIIFKCRNRRIKQ
ncbi:hypothetical protein GALL_60270 [mine drainage metagenome]|uniref:Uncharacterized protein n=1 Tax=mine drainage metagenome TaxID=410659 RepID=A0A1J5T7W9_9ZZZZ